VTAQERIARVRLPPDLLKDWGEKEGRRRGGGGRGGSSEGVPAKATCLLLS